MNYVKTMLNWVFFKWLYTGCPIYVTFGNLIPGTFGAVWRKLLVFSEIIGLFVQKCMIIDKRKSHLRWKFG